MFRMSKNMMKSWLDYYTDDTKKIKKLCTCKLASVKAMNEKKTRGAICSDKGPRILQKVYCRLDHGRGRKRERRKHNFMFEIKL